MSHGTSVAIKPRIAYLRGAVAEDTSKQGSRIKLGAIVTTVATLVGAVVAVITVPGVHAFVFGKDEVERVVTELEGSMTDAGIGRKRLRALNVEVNHCRIWPAEAADRVNKFVTQNRSSVLSRLPDTSDSEARKLVSLFTEAMQWSIKADQQYATWLKWWNPKYRTVKQNGCDVPFEGEEWELFEDFNESAKTRKQLFLRAYNKSARRYDVRRDWEPGDI